MQKSLVPKSTALRRPLRILSGNKTRRPPDSVPSKRPPPAAAQPPESVRSKAHPPEPVRSKPPPPAETPAAVDAALDRLLLARSDLDRIVSQIDEVISDALQCQTVSTRGKQEMESFSVFVSNANASLKQRSLRLKQAMKTSPAETETVSKQTLGIGSNFAVKKSGKLVSSSSNFPAEESVATPSANLLNCSSSNLPEDDMIVSPSPLVSWRTGACMVESGKQLFLLTPLPKTKEYSSRCPTSKAQLKTTCSLDQLDLPSFPVWKLTIADDDRPNPEQVVKVKEATTGIVTPNVTATNKDFLEDRSPCTFSVQKSVRAVPRSCLKTARKQQFSPIPEGSKKEDISSDGTTQGVKQPKSCDDLSSSDEISKDLASRYDLYGFNKVSKNTHRRRRTDDTLQWFLSPLKTCELMNPSDDDKTTPTRETINMRGQQDVPDGQPVQTPALHSKALLATPWKDLESTNLKGRRAGETTLKQELWNRFEAVSTDALHFDKSLFQKIEGKRFLDMLEEEAP